MNHGELELLYHYAFLDIPVSRKRVHPTIQNRPLECNLVNEHIPPGVVAPDYSEMPNDLDKKLDQV
jgi:hypothetical protein